MPLEPEKRIHDLVPDVVIGGISRHLIKNGRRAEEGFPAGEEEEDCLTGDLFRSVRRTWTRPLDVAGAPWRWRITTRKFRGRGELATEHLIGADGIVQIEVARNGKPGFRKGLLFQAKKNWIHRDQDLLRQVDAMEKAAPHGSAIFDYGPKMYSAAIGTDVLQSNSGPQGVHLYRLGDFLAHEFLGCLVGRMDTYFDWELQTLILRGGRPEFYQLYPQFVAAIQIDTPGS